MEDHRRARKPSVKTPLLCTVRALAYFSGFPCCRRNLFFAVNRPGNLAEQLVLFFRALDRAM
jgi:hypothetical protein